jgi:hypothetical protein
MCTSYGVNSRSEFMKNANLSDGAVSIVIAALGLFGVMFSSFLDYRSRERDRRAS